MFVNSFSIHCTAMMDESSKLQMDQTPLCWWILLTSRIANPQMEVRSVIHLHLLCHLRSVCFRYINISCQCHSTSLGSASASLAVSLCDLGHLLNLSVHYPFFLFSQFWLYCLQGRGACCLSQHEGIQLLLLCKVNYEVKLLILNYLYWWKFSINNFSLFKYVFPIQLFS